MARLHELFQMLRQRGGSDLHINAGEPPRMRIHGELEAVPNWPALTDAQAREMFREILTDAQWDVFTRTNDVDFAYSLPNVGRFRSNCYVQFKGAAGAFRMIPDEVLPIEALNMPPAVERVGHFKRGLVLVTGPTGSGKSTTLASIIDVINTNYAKHIITIEEPVEFVHKSKKAVITQREVGQHTENFSAALRAAIRQDPDVIMVGEMRDLETISLAMTAAEMGALVFGTLHTNSAAKTIDRIVDAFPSEQQHTARGMFAESVRAIVSQLLVPKADGSGRIAAVEILLHNVSLPNLIREGNMPMIQTLMQSGKKDGMQLMDDTLMKLCKDSVISAETAYMKANDKKKFEKLLKDEKDAAAGNAPADPAAPAN